jgi:Protein of unknown function (DUF3450)
MRRPTTLLTIATMALILAITPTSAQEGAKKAMQVEDQSLQSSIDVQKRINELDDATRSMLNDYRQTTQQIQDLAAYNEQLSKLVATQRVEMADYERQFEDLEITKRRILPLIVRMIDVLEQFVSVDIPFLEKERTMRIAELKKLMERPDVATSEKYRRVSEAYQIELEYGHTIEAYEGEMDDNGESRTVNFLRFGRLGLYYMSLDGLDIGYWDNSADKWVPLGAEYRQPLDRGIRIARKQLPPDLIRLPIPAPEDRT